jgi:hypothetical protein
MRKIYLATGAMLAVCGLAALVMPTLVAGFFEFNTVRALVYLVTSILTMVAAVQGIGPMRTAGRLLGIVYLALGVLGFVTPDLFGVMPLDPASNVLHLALSLPFLYVSLLAPPRL